MSALRVIEFGRSDQPRWEHGRRYANPAEGYARNQRFVNSDGSNWKPTAPQVANSVWRDAKKARVTVQRGGGLAIDAVDEIRGAPRAKDASGRTKKREWEKSWFQNAVATAGIAGVIGGGVLLRRYARKNPASGAGRVVMGVESRARWARSKAEKAVGGAVNKAADAFGFSSRDRSMILFDAYAEMAGWDVRDPRGKSARVFAPGASRRQRRQSEYHETKEGQRNILVGAGAAAAAMVGAGALAVGLRVGDRRAVKRIVLHRTNAAKEAAKKSATTRAVKSAEVKANPNIIQAFPKRLKGSLPGVA